MHYVDVEDEPHHVEQFCNEYVRVYLATIAPGCDTLYHRHAVDTLYLVISGGLSRSEEPGHQRQRSRAGRSVATPIKLSWWLRRKLSHGIELPTGTILMQYHGRFPLIHRLRAAPTNRRPIQMLGIELLTPPEQLTKEPSWPPGMPVEYEDRQAITYRIDLPPGRHTPQIQPTGPSLLVMLRGQAELRGAGADSPVDVVAPGSPRWLGRKSFELRNPADEPSEAFLIALNASGGRGT